MATSQGGCLLKPAANQLLIVMPTNGVSIQEDLCDRILIQQPCAALIEDDLRGLGFLFDTNESPDPSQPLDTTDEMPLRQGDTKAGANFIRIP